MEHIVCETTVFWHTLLFLEMTVCIEIETEQSKIYNISDYYHMHVENFFILSKFAANWLFDRLLFNSNISADLLYFNIKIVVRV